MKNLNRALVFSLGATVGLVASAHAELYNEVRTELQENVTGQTQLTTPFCFEQSWAQYGKRVNDALAQARETAPAAFVKIPGYSHYVCFEPSLIPESARPQFDQVLNAVETETQSKMALRVPPSEPDSLESSPELMPQKDLIIRRNTGRSFGRMFLRSELFMVPVNFLGMLNLLAQPAAESHWAEHPLKDAGKNLLWGVTHWPVIDGDPPGVNYILHPIGGMFQFSTMRSQGGSFLQSFLFATISSTLWEYGWEATCEKPSIQDLLVTPTVGSALGELQHFATMQLRKNGLNNFKRVVITLFNPMEAFNTNLWKREPRSKIRGYKN